MKYPILKCLLGLATTAMLFPLDVAAAGKTTKTPPPPKAIVKNEDFVVTFNEDGKVRVLAPPAEFDDKGKVKKHTPAELKQLKGDEPAEKKLVGYKGAFDDLKVGDTIEVILGVFKPIKPIKPVKSTASPKEDETADQPTGKWVGAEDFIGKIMKIDKTTKILTVRVSSVVIVPAKQKTNNKVQVVTISPLQRQARLIVIGVTSQPMQQSPSISKPSTSPGATKTN